MITTPPGPEFVKNDDQSGAKSGDHTQAADLPAPVLAELLGFSITTATRWSALAARDNADYVAARIANPPT
jgi:hypothetical protein